VVELKSRLDAVLAFSSPMTIMFSANALSIDGIIFEKKQLYLDLAKQFHFRKIKSLQLSKGISTDELTVLLSLASLPVKVLLEKGGMQRLLLEEHVVNVRVEELDYSLLLDREDGFELEDVGAYLLNQNIQNQETAKLKEFALHFDSVIANLSLKKLVEDSQLKENLYNFLAYLQSNDWPAFERCARSLFRVVLKDKVSATKEQMASFLDFIKNLSREAISETIVEEIYRNDDFNEGNLSIFLQAMGSSEGKIVQSSLAKDLTESHSVKPISAKAAQKLKNLFSLPEFESSLGIYRRTIETLSSSIPSETHFNLDRQSAQRNYRSILLFIFGFEQDTNRLDIIAQNICLEWQNFMRDPVPEHFKAIDAALSSHRDKIGHLHSLAELEMNFHRYLEDSAFENNIPAWLDALIGNLRENTRDEHWYLEKIFSSDNVGKRGILLFLRFFPDHVEELCRWIRQYTDDMDMLGSIIDALKESALPAASDILKDIYGFSNDLIKIEVLKAMAHAATK